MPPLATIRDLEAMLIRADAALMLVKHGKMDGLAALTEVLLPSPAMLEASYSATPDSSVRNMARYLMEHSPNDERPRKRASRLPKRLRQRSVTLDEALAAIS